MSIDNIEKKVLESAKAEAEKITREAQERADGRVKAARAKNEKRAHDSVEQARRALEQERDQHATAARAEGRLKLLARRADILNEVFDAAVDRFVAGRDGAYCEWLSERLASVAGEKGVIVPAEPDRKAISDLLEKQGGDGLEIAAESAPIRGGFLLKGDKMDIDLSLDTRLAETKGRLMPELARRAFAAPAAAEPGDRT